MSFFKKKKKKKLALSILYLCSSHHHSHAWLKCVHINFALVSVEYIYLMVTYAHDNRLGFSTCAAIKIIGTLLSDGARLLLWFRGHSDELFSTGQISRTAWPCPRALPRRTSLRRRWKEQRREGFWALHTSSWTLLAIGMPRCIICQQPLSMNLCVLCLRVGCIPPKEITTKI